MAKSGVERKILSIALNDAESLATVFASIKPEDFSDASHRLVYEAMLELYKTTTVDATTVGKYLADRGNDKLLGLLAELITDYTSSGNLDSYITIMTNESIRSGLLKFSEHVKTQANNKTTDIYSASWNLERELMDIMHRGRTANFQTIHDVARKAYDRVKSMERRDRSLTGITSGFRAIDSVTNGFQPGELIILAARPGMGKTAFALNILVGAATEMRKSGDDTGAVVVFSLEMGAEQLAMRMLSSESQISQSDLKTGYVQNRWSSLAQAVEDLESLPIYIDDSTSLSVMDVYARLKKLSASRKIRMVIVDYLQLLRGDSSQRSRGDNRQQEVAQISRLLKSYAREFEAPFIVLAQLNRDVEKRTNGRPILADLRESGAIEQDADIVSFLITPNNYANRHQQGDEPEPEVDPIDANRADYIIAKNRNGPTKDISLMCDMTTGKFAD